MSATNFEGDHWQQIPRSTSLAPWSLCLGFHHAVAGLSVQVLHSDEMPLALPVPSTYSSGMSPASPSGQGNFVTE